ncbi:MAG: VWA domain-containing protein [Candidatus Saccharibacteria bacterium]|nr:VWA domain-containing protein [Candidatus Saccharibacteria bacterium]
MELRLWWLPLVLLIGLVIAGVLAYRWRRTHSSTDTRKPLAHGIRLTRLPAYQQLIRRQSLVVRGLIVLTALALILSLILSGRPAYVTVTESEMKNRDIILCLDVSGSMTTANKELTAVYAKLAKKFDGERLGMVIFDSSPVTLFPLTNDYDFVSERLAQISQAFDSVSEDFNFRSATEAQKEKWRAAYDDIFHGVNEGRGSSLIGDGLASCVNRFDVPQQKRSRSIIFGTDNYLAGNPIVTLQEAAELAKERDIRVYGINPADHSSGSYTSKYAEDFRRATLLTNGDYYKMNQPAAAEAIIQKIASQDATRFKGSPQLTITDTPEWFVLPILLLTISVIVAGWRMKL